MKGRQSLRIRKMNGFGEQGKGKMSLFENASNYSVCLDVRQDSSAKAAPQE